MTRTPTPHADAISAAIEGVIAAFDAAKSDGYTIPPMAAQGLATANVACVVIEGQEIGRARGQEPEGAPPASLAHFATHGSLQMPPGGSRGLLEAVSRVSPAPDPQSMARALGKTGA